MAIYADPRAFPDAIGEGVKPFDAMGAGMGLDPMTATLISAGSNVLGKALTPTPGGPSRSDATSGGHTEAIFDSSGWNVNFGAGAIDSNREQAPTGAAAWVPWLAIGLVGIVWAKKLAKSQ